MFYDSIDDFCEQFKQQANSKQSVEEYFNEVMRIFPTDDLQNDKFILGFLTELFHDHSEYIGYIFNFLSKKNEYIFNQKHFSNSFNNFILKAAWNISFEAKANAHETVRSQFLNTLRSMAENLAIIIPLNPIKCFNNAISDCDLILQNNKLSNVFALCFFHKITQSRPDLLQVITESNDSIYSNIKPLVSNTAIKNPTAPSKILYSPNNPYKPFNKSSDTPPRRTTATSAQRTNSSTMS
ncbi:MAG: hypothetical protein WC748_00110 [Legionellales bacterium]|jgi:hypothetical protein